MNTQYGVAIWVLAALGLLAILGKVFATVNLSVGK